MLGPGQAIDLPYDKTVGLGNDVEKLVKAGFLVREMVYPSPEFLREYVCFGQVNSQGLLKSELKDLFELRFQMYVDAAHAAVMRGDYSELELFEQDTVVLNKSLMLFREDIRIITADPCWAGGRVSRIR